MRPSKTLKREYAVPLILAVLEEGPRHGYDIAREVERRSGNRVRFNDGTLYPTLHALEEEGCIASQTDPDSGDRPRYVYTLTEHGATVLEKHVAAWHDFSNAVNDVLAQRGGPLGWLRLMLGGRV